MANRREDTLRLTSRGVLRGARREKRMSGCPFHHPAVSKLLTSAALAVVYGVFRAATTQYHRLIQASARSLQRYLTQRA